MFFNSLIDIKFILIIKAAHLSQVEFEYIAYVMGIKLGELHQVLAILKCLAQLLDPRFGTVHTVDTLHGTATEENEMSFSGSARETGYHSSSQTDSSTLCSICI